MQAAFDWFDTTPLLDLLFLGVLIAGIVALLAFAAIPVYRDIQYAKKRKRLLQLAEGSTPTPSSGPRQDFDEEHSHRPRVGLTRRER